MKQQSPAWCGAIVVFVVSAGCLTHAVAAAADRDYAFQGQISRPVLENYLSRSMTCMDLLAGKGNFDDNLRMLLATGVKFAGRTVYRWRDEAALPQLLVTARRYAAKVHAADPEIILQAGAFEIVSEEVSRLAVPERVFAAFGMEARQRTFRYEEMLYPDGRGRDHWRPGASIPDISRPETKLWFYYLAISYIDVGCEAIHFGQAEIMDRNDPEHAHWWELLTKVRQYARDHARRGMVICDAHVPSGGMRYGERLLFDFHSFPLRIVEVPDKPQEGILKVGAFNAIYGRSMGGLTPNGWTCEHLPYLVELDNWGVSRQPGKPGAGSCWVWGYDEMSWFAHQPREYRDRWLRYAWEWVRTHDPNGFLQMPGSRILHAAVDGKWWYFANAQSAATPGGFGDEETIKAIWAADR